MIILEELLRGHKLHYLSGGAISDNHLLFIDAVENLILILLDINFQAKYL